VNPRHHGSARNVHHRRDLLVPKPLDIGVIHHLAKLPW
jgi:hypothetical protein